MNILVDRHQADLLWSLQRLFEDRFGRSLYVPVGHEWWDEEIWQFGHGYGDDRLAQQFLMPWDGVWKETQPGLYVTNDPCHPERPVYGVTYDRARTMDWEFVMPTVPDNQDGYHRFAGNVGARYLCQVGNTGQFVDWSLDPVVLASSEVAFPEGATAIRYHQEMDLSAYPHSPEGFDPMLIVSFLNLFDRIRPNFDAWEYAEHVLGIDGFRFERYGHEQPGGFLSPVHAVGAKMIDAAWGWHDKPVGDGFGHVIHAWAAVGRPVIGHAAHYRGKLAEPFWQDGVTCLDLGARPLEDTIRMIRDCTPARHFEMCWNIRCEFERVVDYDVEADAIRDLIGA